MNKTFALMIAKMSNYLSTRVISCWWLLIEQNHKRASADWLLYFTRIHLFLPCTDNLRLGCRIRWFKSSMSATITFCFWRFVRKINKYRRLKKLYSHYNTLVAAWQLLTAFNCATKLTVAILSSSIRLANSPSASSDLCNGLVSWCVLM